MFPAIGGGVHRGLPGAARELAPRASIVGLVSAVCYFVLVLAYPTTI